MILEVCVDFLDNVSIMGTIGIQPEDSRLVGGASTTHGQADPITDRLVLSLAHAPDISSFNTVGEDLVALSISHSHGTICRDLKSVGVRSVFLSLLGHKTNIGNVTHGSDIKLTIFTAKVHHFGIGSGVASVGDQTLGVLELVVFVPHHTRVTDHTWHRSIHNHITGDMQVGDTLARVYHCEPRAAFVARINISQHFSLLVSSSTF